MQLSKINLLNSYKYLSGIFAKHKVLIQFAKKRICVRNSDSYVLPEEKWIQDLLREKYGPFPWEAC